MADMRTTSSEMVRREPRRWLMPAILIMLLVGIVLLIAFAAVAIYASAQPIDNPLYDLWRGIRPL